MTGGRLSGVRYLIPAGASAEAEIEGGPLQEVAHGVVLTFDDGRELLVRWQMEGEDEYLLFGPAAGDGLLADAVGVAGQPEWRALLGRRIVRRGVARHVPWAGRPLVPWALRLEFEGDRSVVIALGRNEDGVAGYLPTSVVVLFDADVARVYRLAGSSTSAWGDDDATEGLWE